VPRVPVIATVLACLVAAGCGGEDRLSREEYIQRADATCKKYEERLKSLEEELQQTDSPQEAAKVIDRALPIIREGVGELRDLKPPEDLEGKTDEWLDLNDENTKTLEELREAAEEGDEQKIAELARDADENEKRGDAIAREIGLEACAEEE
jgi:hypothetical protein